MKDNFDASTIEGKYGENYFAKQLDAYKIAYKDVTNNEYYQKKDIDFLIPFKLKDRTIIYKTIEIKTDYAAYPLNKKDKDRKNIVYKEEAHEKPGCNRKSEADFVVYILAKNKSKNLVVWEVYIFPTKLMNHYVDEKIKNKELTLTEFTVNADEGTKGHLLPVKELLENKIVEKLRFNEKYNIFDVNRLMFILINTLELEECFFYKKLIKLPHKGENKCIK